MTVILAIPNSWNLHHKTKTKLSYSCGSEKQKIKYFESKKNIYVIDLKRNQIRAHDLKKIWENKKNDRKKK